MRKELYGTRLYINYSKLEQNINYIKSLIKGDRIIAMVKANAYGYGAISIAKKMEKLGINYFGVADFEEGIELRKNGIKSSIMVMNPGVSNIKEIIKNKLEPVIYNDQILSAVINSKELISEFKKNELLIHIKINTGMNRWGFNFLEIPNLIMKLKKVKNIKIKSIYSHLASAQHRKDDLFTSEQIKSFAIIKSKFDKEFNYSISTHIHNSAGLQHFLNTANFCNYFRIGIGLYGGLKDVSIKPVGELRCSVSHIRTIYPGDTVGYGREFIATKKMKIGIVPFGYADGLQRVWGNGVLKFYYKGYLFPTIGNISMDSCAIEILDGVDISEGDEVIYFGEKRPISDLSKELNTIPYEITATLSRRIKRISF